MAGGMQRAVSAARKSRGLSPLHGGRVIQNGQPVATVWAATRDAMVREMLHYALMYEQDGPVHMETRQGGARWKRYRP